MATPLQVLKSDFFRALAHPTRISILERLVQGERSVHDLQSALTLDQPVVSQHLAALRARNVVTVRREGTQAYDALRSPLVADLLRVAREFLNPHLSESQSQSQSMLRELKREDRRGTDVDTWTNWLPKSILALRAARSSSARPISCRAWSTGLTS